MKKRGAVKIRLKDFLGDINYYTIKVVSLFLCVAKDLANRYGSPLH